MNRNLIGIACGLVALTTAGWAATNPPVRIALLSDLHCTRGQAEEQPLHKGRLDRVIQAINAAGVDLVLVAGDLTENGTPTEYNDLRKQLKQLKAPVWAVPGNHDVGNKIIPGKERSEKRPVTAEQIGTFKWKIGDTYFVREHAGVRVAGFNSSLLGSGLREEQAMWDRLEKKLAKPSPLPTLFLMHNPPFINQPDEKGGDYFNVEPKPRQRLLELARRSHAQAVLSGHVHKPASNRVDGILFVTSPPTAFGLPRLRQPKGWVFLTVTPAGDVQAEFRYIGD
jgi:3',5'-cyclic-AMP phosphodiesterase